MTHGPQKQPFFFKVTSFIRWQTGQQNLLNEKFRIELNIKWFLLNKNIKIYWMQIYFYWTQMWIIEYKYIFTEYKCELLNTNINYWM